MKCLSKCIKLYFFQKKKKKRICVHTLPKIFRPVTRNTLFYLALLLLQLYFFLRCHREELDGHRGQCDKVLNEVSSALDYLMDLQRQYINVSTKTNALHEACEHLLAEQVTVLLIST